MGPLDALNHFANLFLPALALAAIAAALPKACGGGTWPVWPGRT